MKVILVEVVFSMKFKFIEHAKERAIEFCKKKDVKVLSLKETLEVYDGCAIYSH